MERSVVVAMMVFRVRPGVIDLSVFGSCRRRWRACSRPRKRRERCSWRGRGPNDWRRGQPNGWSVCSSLWKKNKVKLDAKL